MCFFFRALALAVLLLGLWAPSRRAAFSLGFPPGVTLYDPNPAHLWNRLHAALYIREDIPSTSQVPDALDPPLWPNTRYLLSEPSHQRVTKILDEFLQTRGERLIQDPLRRAMLERDLWSVFDWTAQRAPERPGEPAYEKELQELQSRLAEALRRLALSAQQIRALPENYRQAVASGQFAKQYDPQHRDRAFLPPDLFDAHSSWVQLAAPGAGITPEPAAAAHAEQFSRSSFLIFMRLPEGRKATFDYLHALWDFPRPWIPRPDVGEDVREQTAENPRLPQFPVGTQFALVRQLLLFDDHGTLQSAPITESVQIRVYRSVTPNDAADSGSAQEFLLSGQDFYEIVLSRRLLFAGKAGGLRETGRKEKTFALLNSFGADEGTSAKQFAKLDDYPATLESCAVCHRGGGINSVNSRRQLLKPNWLIHDYPDPPAIAPARTNTLPAQWWEFDRTASSKQSRFDWGLLSGYWKADPSER
ncbi:MAG: hypothetical protein ABSG16_01910 [Candidatus Acidiferrum sp.]